MREYVLLITMFYFLTPLLPPSLFSFSHSLSGSSIPPLNSALLLLFPLPLSLW